MENNSPFNDTHECDELLICVAPGCNSSNVTNKSLQFHRFPDLEIGKLWQTSLGMVVKPRNYMDAVCSQHFRDEDYLEELYLEGTVEKTRRTLKSLALPHVTLSQPHEGNLFFDATELTCREEWVSTGSTAGPVSIYQDRQKANSPQQGGNKKVKEEDYSEISTQTVDKLYRRDDKALSHLTQKFVEILKSCPHGLLDINQAVEELKVSRRRIYDITNVLEGVFLVKKKSKRIVQWLGSTPNVMLDERLKHLTDEENKLDDIIKGAKQHMHYMHESALHNKYAYLTYEDLQSIPVFEDQAVFVIKAPSETTLEVAHPKEAFQLHILSKNGPVNIFGCTDTVDVTQSKRQKSKFDDGDYSNVPLRGLTSAAAASFKGNANQNTKSDNISTSPAEPTRSLMQNSNLHMSSEPTSVIPPLEVQNSSTPIPPLSICIKEEMTNLNITPDELMNESFALVPDPDQLSTDVHMTDLS